MAAGAPLIGAGTNDPQPGPDPTQAFRYFVYGAAVSEVELDVLCGSIVVRQSDLLYDAGQCEWNVCRLHEGAPSSFMTTDVG